MKLENGSDGGRLRLRQCAMGTTYVIRLALLLGLLLYLMSPPGICAAFRNLEEGKPVPDFTLKDTKGMDHTLSAEKGRVVALIFVKVDQDRSIKAMNDLTRVHGILKDNGFTVWAVTSQTDDKAALEALATKLDLGYPILMDEGDKLYGQYGLFTFPATGLIDQQGNFTYEYGSYSGDYQQTITDRAKLLLGLISQEDFAKSSEKKEIVERPKEEIEAERSLQMAKVLLQRGFGTKAIPKLEEALKLNPNLLEARILAGEVYLKDEKYPEARLQFEKALETDPKSTDARIGIASVLTAENRLDEAEAELQKALTLNPDPAVALYRLGQVYEKKNQTQKAMETYRAATENLLKKAAKEK